MALISFFLHEYDALKLIISQKVLILNYCYCGGRILCFCVWRLISLSLSEAYWSELRSAEHTFSEAHERRVSL